MVFVFAACAHDTATASTTIFCRIISTESGCERVRIEQVRRRDRRLLVVFAATGKIGDLFHKTEMRRDKNNRLDGGLDARGTTVEEKNTDVELRKRKKIKIETVIVVERKWTRRINNRMYGLGSHGNATGRLRQVVVTLSDSARTVAKERLYSFAMPSPPGWFLLPSHAKPYSSAGGALRYALITSINYILSSRAVRVVTIASYLKILIYFFNYNNYCEHWMVFF